MSRNMMIRTSAGKALFLVATGFLTLLAARPAGAEMRSAATTVGVRIERHAGVVLAPSRTELGRVTVSGVTLVGNGAPQIISSSVSAASVKPTSREVNGRTEITVFEP
jgi:hypothetical protein